MFRSGANALGFSTLGLERLTIDSSGNVGVGTTGPGVKLHIYNNGSVLPLIEGNSSDLGVGLMIRNNSAGATSAFWRIGVDGTAGATQGNLFFRNDQIVDGLIPLVINSSGNVGIGTTAPGSLLHLYGSAPKLTIQNSAATINSISFVNSAGTEQASLVYSISGGRFESTSVSNIINVLGDSAGTYFFDVRDSGGNSKVRILSSGNVGIGTTTPKGTKLFVADTGAGATASSSFSIRSSFATGSVASISATSLTSGNVLQLTVPASTSGGGAYLLVKDTAGAIYASLSSGGRFSIRRSFFSRGSDNTNCTTVGAGCIDYAENFHTMDNSIEAGDVIALDPSSDSQDIIKAKTGDILIGVISSNPGVLLRGNTVRVGTADSNESITEDYNNGFRPVALAGRVPVKISFENGDIKKGDYLTSSSIPGKAAKANKQGRVIGIALESATQDSNKTQIMLLINPHWAGQELDVNGRLADFSGLSPLLEQNPGLIESILAYLKDAVLTVRELVAEVVSTKKLCVGQTCVTEDQFKQLLDKAQVLPASPSSSDSSQPSPTGSGGQAGSPAPSSPSPTPSDTPSPSPQATDEQAIPTPTSELTPTSEPTPTPEITPAPETPSPSPAGSGSPATDTPPTTLEPESLPSPQATDGQASPVTE